MEPERVNVDYLTVKRLTRMVLGTEPKGLNSSTESYQDPTQENNSTCVSNAKPSPPRIAVCNTTMSPRHIPRIPPRRKKERVGTYPFSVGQFDKSQSTLSVRNHLTLPLFFGKTACVGETKTRPREKQMGGNLDGDHQFLLHETST